MIEPGRAAIKHLQARGSDIATRESCVYDMCHILSWPGTPLLRCKQFIILIFNFLKVAADACCTLHRLCRFGASDSVAAEKGLIWLVEPNFTVITSGADCFLGPSASRDTGPLALAVQPVDGI